MTQLDRSVEELLHAVTPRPPADRYSDWEDVLSRAADGAATQERELLAPPGERVAMLRGRSPARTALAVAGALAILGALALAWPFGADQVSPIERARAALAVPKDGVFHVRIEFRETGQRMSINEVWQSPSSYRSKNTGQPERGGRSDGTQELYDSANNTIYAYRDPSTRPRPLIEVYTADMLRLLSRPDAQVVAGETIDGIDCVRIESHTVLGTISSYYADARTYRPVLARQTSAGGRSEFRFRVWEMLPSPHGKRLSDLRLVFPGARIVVGAATFWRAEARLLHLPLPRHDGPPAPLPLPQTPASSPPP